MTDQKEHKEARGAREGRRVSASDLKNQWHTHLDRVSRVHEELVITRYGKPIAKLVPYEGEERQSLVGCLAETVTVLGDIVAPTGEEWEVNA